MAGRRQLRRRRPRLRQRPPAPDPAAHRSAGARPAAGDPLARDLGRGGLPGLVPADRQRAGLVHDDRPPAELPRLQGPAERPGLRGHGVAPGAAGLRARAAGRAGEHPRDAAAAGAGAGDPAALGHGHRQLAAAALDARRRCTSTSKAGSPRRSSRRRPTTPSAWRVAAQLRAGVDVVTDGEQRRDNYASFVGGRLDNCQLIPLTDLLPLRRRSREVRAELQAARRAGLRGPPPGRVRPARAQPAARRCTSSRSCAR